MKNRGKLQRWLPNKINLNIIEWRKDEVEKILLDHWEKLITDEEARNLILDEFTKLMITTKAMNGSERDNDVFLRILRIMTEKLQQSHIAELLQENKELNNRHLNIKKLFSVKYLANVFFDTIKEMLKT